MSYKVPILLITFNRPDHVRASLSEIRKQRPEKLYVFQDGPREGRNDLNAILETRKVIEEMVDWSCELKTNYQEKNLGCGLGPYTAISWLLENEEYGVIMEDDIVAHPCFFSFMEDMLSRYKDDDRIGMVTGHNMQRFYSLSNSYYFTYRMDGTWGWGTWKRVWTDFQLDIPLEEDKFRTALWKFYNMPKPYVDRQIAFYQRWMRTEIDRHSYWDYQFDYYLMQKGYLNIRPNSCLTSNIGTIGEATHNFPQSDRYLMEVNEKLYNPIIHPKYVMIDFIERLRIMSRTIKVFLSGK